MKFSVACETLLSALQKIIGAIDRKQVKQELSFILLEVRSDGSFEVAATDAEIEISANGSLLAVSEPESITLPGKKLFDICKSLPPEVKLDFEERQGQIAVTANKSRFLLSKLSARDFPRIKISDKALKFTMPQSKLKELLLATHFAMANQDVRHYFMGMLWELAENKFITVASDGHRLSLGEVKQEFKQKGKIIVPRKGILELLRLLEPVDKSITIFMDQRHVKIQAEDFTCISLLIDAEFPNYRHIFPMQYPYVAQLDRDELRKALLRAAILTNEKCREVSLAFRPQALSLITSNAEQERAEESISLDYQGEMQEITFNVGYILDVLGALPAGELNFNWQRANGPMLIKSQQDTDIKHIVMPMRL